MNATMASPSASFNAVSKLSDKRCWMSGRTFRRSITHVDVVLLVLFQFRRVFQFCHDAIDAGSDIAAGLEFAEHMQMFALAVTHQWRQHHQARALWQGQHLVHHLADRLGLQLLVMRGAVRIADAGEQQPQINREFP
jgi:hypothetical protein